MDLLGGTCLYNIKQGFVYINCHVLGITAHIHVSSSLRFVCEESKEQLAREDCEQLRSD